MQPEIFYDPEWLGLLSPKPAEEIVVERCKFSHLTESRGLPSSLRGHIRCQIDINHHACWPTDSAVHVYCGVHLKLTVTVIVTEKNPSANT